MFALYSSLKDTVEALLMHAGPTYCYANKALEMDQYSRCQLSGF